MVIYTFVYTCKWYIFTYSTYLSTYAYAEMEACI